MYHALAEARDLKGQNPLDRAEFEIIVRKHKILNVSEYLSEAFDTYGNILSIILLDSDLLLNGEDEEEKSHKIESAKPMNSRPDSQNSNHKVVFTKPPKAEPSHLVSIDKYHGVVLPDAD